jgi:hypothetical protein
MALVTPDGSPDYNTKIIGLLANIRKNSVGNLVLNAIVKPVKIRPIGAHLDPKTKKPDQNPNSCQGITSADDRSAANIALKKPGEEGYDKKRDKFYSSSMRGYVFDEVPKSGGSTSVLYFTPGEKGLCVDHKGASVAADSDATLLHELVHAARISQGIVSAVPTTEHEFRHEEEFLGIEIENVYKSARDGKKAKLRHSHSPDAEDIPEWNTSKGFVDEYDLAKVLKYHAHWGLFKELAKLGKIPFNPFYEYDQRQKVKAKPKVAPNKPVPAGAGRK